MNWHTFEEIQLVVFRQQLTQKLGGTWIPSTKADQKLLFNNPEARCLFIDFTSISHLSVHAFNPIVLSCKKTK